MSYADLIRNEPSAKNMRTLIASGIEENQSIANSAVSTATTLGNDAKTIANQAKSVADNTNSRVNNIIAHGTEGSLEELVDIREDATGFVYESSGEHIRVIDLSLTDMSTFKLAGDVTSKDGKLYKTNNFVDIEFIRNKQVSYYGQFYRSLRRNEAVKLTIQGDSIIYGQDTTSSDKRTAPTDTLPNGSHHSFTRAGKTITEAMQDFLTPIYANLTIENRGYSGDGTELSYTRWITNPSAGMTLISLGINDATGSWVEYMGDVDNYLAWYEQLIVRAILWGSAVIIMTPIKPQNPVGVSVDTFSNALYLLGQKYCIPVITGDELLQNYDPSIYSDGLHLNTKGYTILGAKISSFFVGEGVTHKRSVFGGTKLACRQTIDNIQFFGSASNGSVAGAYSPDENTDNASIVGSLFATGGVVYSFYAETEDLILVPTYYVGTNATLKIELDFGVEQPDYTLDSALGKSSLYTENQPSTIDRATTTISYTNSSLLGSPEKFQIVTKGWHTVKFTLTAGAATISGLDFIDYKVFNSSGSSLKTHYQFLTHPTSSDGTSVTTTRIAYDTLYNALNIKYIIDEYWKAVPIRIIVYNFNQSILEYKFCLAAKTDGVNGWYFISTPNRLNIASPVGAERTITNITFDNSSKEIVITWGGTLTRSANVVITI